MNIRWLKFRDSVHLQKSDLLDDEYATFDYRIYVDNKNNPFTGIGIVINTFYYFYLNGKYIGYSSDLFLIKNKLKLEEEFNILLKETVFK